LGLAEAFFVDGFFAFFVFGLVALFLPAAFFAAGFFQLMLPLHRLLLAIKSPFKGYPIV
jgi:hypothetical protein